VISGGVVPGGVSCGLSGGNPGGSGCDGVSGGDRGGTSSGILWLNNNVNDTSIYAPLLTGVTVISCMLTQMTILWRQLNEYPGIPLTTNIWYLNRYGEIFPDLNQLSINGSIDQFPKTE
jgi:hypothetical protein